MASAAVRFTATMLHQIPAIPSPIVKANELTVIEYRPLEIYTILIVEYLVLILVVSFFARKIEVKLDMGREEK